MKEKAIAGLYLYHDAEEGEAAELIGLACERSVKIFQQRWGLATPAECRVYVMAGWKEFLFQSAPWPWKVYLFLTLPIIARRARQIWPFAGGWALQYGARRVVGVKPPRLIETSDRSLGEKIFVQDRSQDDIVQTVTCHELMHAFTAHLKLPTWLKEGLAILAMEYYLDRRIVRQETIESLRNLPVPSKGRASDRLSVDDPQALIAQYVQGYWLTRYVDETQLELVKHLLVTRLEHTTLEERVASAYGKDRDSFWNDINHELVTWFESRT